MTRGSKLTQVAALGCAGALVLAATGCSTGGGGGAESIVPPPADDGDPRAALVASAQYLETMTFRSDGTRTAGVVSEAIVDPATEARWSKLSVEPAGGYIAVERLVVGGDSYARIESEGVDFAPDVPAEWMRLDLSRLADPEPAQYREPDPTQLASEVFPALVSVERADEWTFTGTIDLPNAVGSGLVNEGTVDALGDQATGVEFKATLDASGRLARFQIFAPATEETGPEIWHVHYFDYGGPAELAPPADASDATDELYAWFNDD